MVLECWVILLILGIAAYMFIRSKRRLWAVGVLPLMLVPFVNILYSPFGRHIMRHGLERENTVRLLIYFITFLIASVWMFFWSRKLSSKKSRNTYLICSVVFTALLILLFIDKLIF